MEELSWRKRGQLWLRLGLRLVILLLALWAIAALGPGFLSLFAPFILAGFCAAGMAPEIPDLSPPAAGPWGAGWYHLGALLGGDAGAGIPGGELGGDGGLPAGDGEHPQYHLRPGHGPSARLRPANRGLPDEPAF